METAKLTLQLPKQDLEFAEQYARAQRISLSELFDRYLKHLRTALRTAPNAKSRSVEANSWQEFFRIGDSLTSEDPSEEETLTAAVLAMRR